MTVSSDPSLPLVGVTKQPLTVKKITVRARTRLSDAIFAAAGTGADGSAILITGNPHLLNEKERSIRKVDMALMI